MLLLSALASTACRTTKSVSLEHLNALKPDRAWVTNQDQSVVVLVGPHVVADTLAGYVDGKYEQLLSAGLRRVTVRTPAPARTVLLATGVAIGVGGLVIALSGSRNDEAHILLDDCNKRPTDPGCRN
jgi:hypothetical protein